jgi:hypothetical protein
MKTIAGVRRRCGDIKESVCKSEEAKDLNYI